MLIQVLLFRNGATDTLAIVNLALGWPALILLLAGSYLYGLWRLRTLRGPSVDEFRNRTPPPWRGQKKGFQQLFGPRSRARLPQVSLRESAASPWIQVRDVGAVAEIPVGEMRRFDIVNREIAVAGSKNRDIDGPTEIWAFFEEHPASEARRAES